MSLLEVSDLRAGYGPIRVLHGLDFHLDTGEIVVLLGANGAGKTTTLRALSGMIATRGSVVLDGTELVGFDTADVVRHGIAHVPQGRGTLPELSVEDNLLVGGYIRSGPDVRSDIDGWFDTFPVLGRRRRQMAGSLSGGEQQMLAVARALMSRPRLLLLDEPSLGLAPMLVAELFEQFSDLNAQRGTTILVVEQNAPLALGIADRGYVLESGRLVISGDAAQLRADKSIRKAYLGV